jgi:hypothetical protein
MDATLAIGPVISSVPSPASLIFQSTKEPFDFLLTGVAQSLLGSPIHAVGEQNRTAQTAIHESLLCRSAKIELQPTGPRQISRSCTSSGISENVTFCVSPGFRHPTRSWPEMAA